MIVNSRNKFFKKNKLKPRNLSFSFIEYSNAHKKLISVKSKK